MQAGQVEEQRRELAGGLALFLDLARLAGAARDDRIGTGLVPQAGCRRVFVVFILAEALVEPAADVRARGGAEMPFELPVIARDELADTLFAFGDQGQGRRLNPPDRGQVEAAPSLN